MTWGALFSTGSRRRQRFGKQQKGRARRPFCGHLRELFSALTCLEARIALADNEHFAAAAHDLAIAVALLGGLERGQDFHGNTQIGKWGMKPRIVKHCARKGNTRVTRTQRRPKNAI
jgi:hypothetical protein